MFPILQYILLTAIRDRLYLGLFIILLATFGISYALGDASLIERQHARIAYISGSSRFIFAIGMILFVCFYVRKSFEHREVEFILSKPISRHNFILAYLLGFSLVAILILLPLIALLIIMKASISGIIYWSISLLFESLIIINFSLLAALILKNAVPAALASLGFYILSRLMGFFVFAIKIPESAIDITTTSQIMNMILKSISVILPRLDLYAKSEWLIYGFNDFTEFKIILIQSLVYIPLMVFMAFYDFKNKQF